jgi:AraC family transcriptional regulator
MEPLMSTAMVEMSYGTMKINQNEVISHKLTQIAATLNDIVTRGDDYPVRDKDSLVTRLGHELVRLKFEATPAYALGRGGLTGWQQKKLANYIEERLSEELPLSELAAVVGLSRFHFARAFKQSFGLPPHRYHMNRRMERAKTLLAAERSVTEVAMEVGFAETSSFSAAFRRTMGIAPSAFRRSSV